MVFIYLNKIKQIITEARSQKRETKLLKANNFIMQIGNISKENKTIFCKETNKISSDLVTAQNQSFQSSLPKKKSKKSETIKTKILTELKNEYLNSLIDCLSINESILNKTINLLESMKIKYVLSPCESDSQLAYLYHNKDISGIISEDSDYLAYGILFFYFRS